MTSFTVGKDGDGKRKLENGRHLLTLGYLEKHRFGDIAVGREAQVRRTFFVKQ